MSDIKPYFRDDLARSLHSVYVSAKGAGLQGERLNGFLLCLGSLALLFGLNAGDVVSSDDANRLREVCDV